MQSGRIASRSSRARRGARRWRASMPSTDRAGQAVQSRCSVRFVQVLFDAPMIRLDRQRTAAGLVPAITRMFDLSAQKIRSIEDSWRAEDGSPVFTAGGVYRSRGWTEWTQGF